MKSYLGTIRKSGIALMLGAVLIASTPTTAQPQQVSSVMHKMFHAIENLQTMSFYIKLRERLKNGEYNEAEQNVSVMLVPTFKCRLYMKVPKAGPELLYVSGEYKDKAIYSEGILKLKLNPRGKRIRQDKHHTIFQLGFKYIGGILKDYFTLDSTAFKYHGEITWNGIQCYHMELSSDKYGIEEYTTQWGDDVISIARKNNISEYKILELNEHLKDNYYNLKPYQPLKISKYYAQRLVFYVDKRTHLPVYQKVIDEKGLFEEYEYRNMKVNFQFPEKEFSADALGEQ